MKVFVIGIGLIGGSFVKDIKAKMPEVTVYGIDANEAHPKRRNFLACHPIAGTEFSGPSAAINGLYEGKTNIICEVEKTAFQLQEKALRIFQLLGMRIRYMK